MTPPCIFPTLRYRDAEAAIGWLTGVFGFREHAVQRDPDGMVLHAQLAFGSSIIMLGQERDDDYGALIGQETARRTDAFYVAVENPDAMCDAVERAGGRIEMALQDTDYGSREFTCRDPEGNLWSFGTYWPKVDA